MARQNPRRTGAAVAASNLIEPVPYYRYFLGGTLESDDFLAGDVDDDGSGELFLIIGGRVVSKRPNDQLLWQSELLEMRRLYAITDLDGDGAAELVASSGDNTYVFDAVTGAILWSQDSAVVGSFADLRIADFDGDGLADLYAENNPCGVVTPQTPGTVFSFAGGFASPTTLWTVLERSRCGSFATTLVDVDGDGDHEVLVGSTDKHFLQDEQTGAVLAETVNVGTRADYARCRGVDVDGIVGEEIVCLWNFNGGPTFGSRRVTLERYDGSSLVLIWSHDLGDYNGGSAELPPGAIADLDGDGLLEIVAGGRAMDGTWTTSVLDAATGALLDTAPGQPVGVAELSGSGGSAALVRNGGALVAMSFDGALATVWSAPDRALVTYRDPDLRVRQFDGDAVALLDLQPGGSLELLLRDVQEPRVLRAVPASTNPPADVATLSLPEDVGIAGVWVFPPLGNSGAQVAMVATDGILNTLDGALAPVSGSLGSGVRVGGYYSGNNAFGLAPLAADVGGAPRLLVNDSRSSLLVLDATMASLAYGPELMWSKRAVGAALVAPGIANGGNAVVVKKRVEPLTEPPVFQIQALDGAGSPLWSAPLPPSSSFDLVVGDFNGDPTVDLAFEFAVDQIRTVRAINGTNGFTLWQSTPVDWYGVRPLSAADHNGDGRDDVYAVLHAPRVYDGTSGAQLVSGTANLNYMLPIPYDIDGNGTNEVILTGGVDAERSYASNLSTTQWVAPDDEPLAYGAIADCPGGAVLVSGTRDNPARYKITQLATGARESAVLAQGTVFADESAALAAGAQLGTVGDVTVGSDLLGNGQPIAMIPSTDGFLYGLDACAGMLVWAVDLEAPVGEAVLGDLDGDGNDEIIATVADGFVYGLKHEEIPGPDEVIEIDPPSGILNEDVDVIDSEDTLWVKWTEVPGAAGYEVTLISPDGEPASVPTWIPVAGDVTELELNDLALELGRRYVFAVRAVNPAGKLSPDVLSDGVVPGEAGGMGGGGSGGEGGQGGTGGTGGFGGMDVGGFGGAGGGIPDDVLLVGRSCLYCASAPPSRDSYPWLLAFTAALLAMLRRQRRA